MNRADKRRMDRTEIWFNSLSEDKKQIIYGIINEKVDSNNIIMATISDICTVSALDDVLDIDISKIKDIITKTKEYMVDYGEYLEKEKNGGIIMIEDQELREKVKTKIKVYMKGKMDKSKGLKLLKSEFNLPYGELSDLWIEVKSHNYGRTTDRVLEKEDKSKTEATANKDIIVPDPEVTSLIAAGITNMNNEPVKKNNLKVISITTEVEGEYGHYTKNVDGVKIGDNLYRDKEMIRKERIVSSSMYNTKMDNVRDRIKALNIELKEIQDKGIKELDRFDEIELVFDL